uniref:ORF46j n=1 Tax=Pinus koraiensis TaxID=88728 RepID=A4QMG0_PINKO|nr:ORF46j [Pinus koraiensis]ABP35497.1 ORF46j [Pinus koraiensis]
MRLAAGAAILERKKSNDWNDRVFENRTPHSFLSFRTVHGTRTSRGS